MSSLDTVSNNQPTASKDEIIEKQRIKIKSLTNKIDQQENEIEELKNNLSSKEKILFNLTKSNNNLTTQLNNINDINNNLKEVLTYFESNEKNPFYRTLEENNVLIKQINKSLLDYQKIISSDNKMDKNNHLIDEKINKIEENLFLINKKVTINSLKIEEMQDFMKLLNNYHTQK